jgi:protein involved in polysaccharide export with SLBB domain
VARDRIRQHIARIEADPMVWVEPMLRIVVTGEVRQPGLYPVRYPTTIAQAIAQAGGTTELARVDRIQFIRAGAPQRIDLRHPTAQHARIVLQSGDEIVVPRRSTAFRDAMLPLSTLASVAALVVTIATR